MGSHSWPLLASSDISQKVFTKLLSKSQSPHKSVNFSFIITNIKDKLTDLCGNSLLHNDFTNTLCGIDLGLPQLAALGLLGHAACEQRHRPVFCL